jgi:glycosyltransferase involved in cell wall biosynthesis
MRIGFLTYGLDRSPTGIGRYAVELLRALAQQPTPHEIVLLSTEREDRHQLWHRFEHYALSGCHLLPMLISIGQLTLARAARRYSLDLVHDPNGIAPFLGLDARVRRIVTLHDTCAYIYPGKHNRLDNWRYHTLLPRAARQADAVITVSECSRVDLMQHLQLPLARIHSTSEGIDPKFRPAADDQRCAEALARYGIDRPYILYVGSLNARKNIGRLFAAYKQLLDQHPTIKLVVGGKRQWQAGEIDTALNRFNLHGAVHFTGYIADGDLPAIYSAAEVFVFPSLYEGFGLPPLEAMACGTPVVTSNVSSLPEVVGDAALTVDPYDVNALAAAIGRLLTDTSLRRELRVRGLAHAAQFTWERSARETLAVYEDVLGRDTSVEHAWRPAVKKYERGY